jgi:hypothetical protein
LLLLLPLLCALATLLYFKGYERYYSDRFSDLLFEQKVEQFSAGVLLYGALSLDDSAALSVLLPIIENTDSEPGVYARVLDREMRILNRPRYDPRRENRLLEFLDPSHPDYLSSIEKIRRDSTGHFRVLVDGKELRIHHWRFAINGLPYHTVIGVAPGVLGQIVNMNRFTLGIIFLCLCTVTSVYYTIFLIFKGLKK